MPLNGLVPELKRFLLGFVGFGFGCLLSLDAIFAGFFTRHAMVSKFTWVSEFLCSFFVLDGSKWLHQTHRARFVVLGCQDPARRSMSEWSVVVARRWFLKDQDWLLGNAPLERHREMHRGH